ncbi:MAG: RNA 2'-phosphotransferase [Desulfobacterales bacterium]|nr:RNA 2'-phosphotransferase [Desulfobacterales bacterium]
MKPGQSAKKLAKFLSYILGRKPDHFGLLPDADGYVKIKDLLKALACEEGFRHVRASHIDEILYTLPDPPIEIKESLIRATDRQMLPEPVTADHLPGLLYIAIKRKSWPFVHKKGLIVSSRPYIMLSSEQVIANKYGKSLDRKPVLLTIHANMAQDTGVCFLKYGDHLFLSDEIPPECITGPPLPKQQPEKIKTADKKREEKAKTPGSFMMDITKDQIKPSKRYQKDKNQSWKKDRKRIRKEKESLWD